MKKTEQRWMHIATGDLSKLDMSGQPGYQPCTVTVTWDEPEWEDVEVVRMYCPECQTVMTKKEHEQNNCCKNAVELRGTYRRRKPEPEVWEGPTKRSVSGDVAIIQLSSEWIGKRVRVEVVE